MDQAAAMSQVVESVRRNQAILSGIAKPSAAFTALAKLDRSKFSIIADLARQRAAVGALPKINITQSSALATLVGRRAAAGSFSSLHLSQSSILRQLGQDYALGGQLARQLAAPRSVVREFEQHAALAAKMADIVRPNTAIFAAMKHAQAQSGLATKILAGNVRLLELGQFSVSPSHVIGRLPNVRALATWIERDERGREVLAEAGFEVVYNWLGGSFVVGLEAVSPQLRGAAVTNRVLARTRGGEFEEQLQDHFLEAPLLKKRWQTVSEGLEAHRGRKYHSSVSTLFPVLEGLIGDALVLVGKAKKVKGKFYAMDSAGELKRDRHGRRIELKGLREKVEHFPIEEHEFVRHSVDLVKSELGGRRNKVLHGSDVRFGSAKLSTQLLLSIYLWAVEIADFVN
jgi:hypothetical protein